MNHLIIRQAIVLGAKKMSGEKDIQNFSFTYDGVSMEAEINGEEFTNAGKIETVDLEQMSMLFPDLTQGCIATKVDGSYVKGSPAALTVTFRDKEGNEFIKQITF